jgi:hypothetical protein
MSMLPTKSLLRTTLPVCLLHDCYCSDHHFLLTNPTTLLFKAKPPQSIKHNRPLLSSKKDEQKPLVRRDSSFMKSVMDELSLASQSSVSSSASLSLSEKSDSSSYSLKRPSPVASDNDSRPNREDYIRPRVESNHYHNNPPERLTLPQTNAAKLKSKEPNVISQVRTVRTVSRFFLSSSMATQKKEVATPAEKKSVIVNEKKDMSTAAKKVVPIDEMLASQKVNQADKVLLGIKSKFSFQVSFTLQYLWSKTYDH